MTDTGRRVVNSSTSEFTFRNGLIARSCGSVRRDGMGQTGVPFPEESCRRLDRTAAGRPAKSSSNSCVTTRCRDSVRPPCPPISGERYMSDETFTSGRTPTRLLCTQRRSMGRSTPWSCWFTGTSYAVVLHPLPARADLSFDEYGNVQQSIAVGYGRARKFDNARLSEHLGVRRWVFPLWSPVRGPEVVAMISARTYPEAHAAGEVVPITRGAS
jgi:hypothetical protein